MLAADSPWKDVCEKKLSLVYALLYPRIHGELDWALDYEALDQELRKFAPDSTAGGRIADRLIKAFTKGSGDPRYFHLEVQGKKERHFRRRVHVCNLRAEERFNSHVISLVVLTDENPRWRPRRYVAGQVPASEERHQGRTRYLDERTLRFLTVKLIDFRGREGELEALDNPMGLFVVAHLEAMRTRNDPVAREQAKLRLLGNLRQRKMDHEDTRFWMSCLDWFLQLPKAREEALWRELHKKDKEDNVAFLSYPERKGVEKGRLESLGWYLKAKFADEALSWLATVEKISDQSQQEALCQRIYQADTAEQIRALIASAAADTSAQS